MRSTRALNVTLPSEMAELVDAKIASREYANPSEVIGEGLRLLQARDAAVEHWLRTDVAATYDAHRHDPSRARTVDQVMAGLERRFAAASASGRDA